MLTRVGLASAACLLFAHTANAQQTAPQQPYPQQPYPQQPQQPYPQQPQQPYPQQPYAQQPYAQQPQQPYAQQPYAQQPQQPYAQQPYAQQPQQPYAQQPYAQQPYAQPQYAQPQPIPAPAAAPLAAGAYGRRGSMEAEGSLGLGFPTPSGADFDVMFGVGFHYFVMNGLSVGGALRIGYITGIGGAAVFQFVPGAQYHFTIPGSRVIPYGGAGLGFDYLSGGGSGEVCDPYCHTVSNSDTAFLLDLEGGVKISLNPHMLVGGGIDVPIALHTGQNMAYVNVLGRFIYAF